MVLAPNTLVQAGSFRGQVASEGTKTVGRQDKHQLGHSYLDTTVDVILKLVAD